MDITAQSGGNDASVTGTGVLGGRSYVMFGKVQVTNESAVTNVRCSLEADNEISYSLVRLPANGIATVPLQLSTDIPGLLGIMRLRCWAFGNDASASNASLTAIEVGTLTTDT